MILRDRGLSLFYVIEYKRGIKMKNIFGNYQLFAIDINDGELPIKTAPIFEIDKFTREFSSKQEIIDMLNERGYHIKDIKLKR